MKNKILDLYNKSFSFNRFMGVLKNNENYKDAYEWFIGYKKKTCYFKQKKSFIQAVYNLLHGIESYPLYADGTLKVFKSFQQGYYSQDDLNSGRLNIKYQEIKDEKYMFPAVFHIKKINRCFFNNKIFSDVIRRIFGQNFDKIPLRSMPDYIKMHIFQPLYCKICGKLIQYPAKYGKDICGNIICRETYGLTADETDSYLKNIFLKDGHKFDKVFKQNRHIFNMVKNKLLQWFSEDEINSMTPHQKAYHYLYNIKQIPLCAECRKNYVKFDYANKCYKTTCSRLCNNIYIKNIEKRLKNKTPYGSIGKNQYYIINDLYPDNDFKKIKVGPFAPDFTDIQHKEVFEINQIYHLHAKKIRSDKRKYGYLKANGWKINVIWDFYTDRLTEHYLNRITQWNKMFQNFINSNMIYSNQNQKILTDTGWSMFKGLVKFSGRDTIRLQNGIECTPDHIIYDQNMKQNRAAQLKKQDSGKQDVYDILQVDRNNRFFINSGSLVHNCLLLDQFAFIAPGISDAFMASVFPVVSSSKNSKIIIVSTPKGTANEYYKIYNKAIFSGGEDMSAWHGVRIDWWDVPGRDEEWKKQRLVQFGGNTQKFAQEYGNEFLGSAPTLISGQKLKQFKKQFQNNREEIKQPRQLQLHPDFSQLKINVYQPPQKGRAYIIGADPSTGMQSDYHAMTVWDITNIYNIQLVADFHQNNMPPKFFAFIVVKTAMLYNKAFVAIENNGVSFATLDKIIDDFQYQNVIFDGKNKNTVGISSSDDKKLDACLHLKQFIEDPLRKIRIYNGQLVQEMQHFQKKTKTGHQPRYLCQQGHDDFIMCMLWAFYYLRPQPLDNYYKIMKYGKDKFGNDLPLIVTSEHQMTHEQSKEIFQQLDRIFSSTTKSYDIQMEQLKQKIQNSQNVLMNQFQQSDLNKNKSQNDDFQFDAWFS